MPEPIVQSSARGTEVRGNGRCIQTVLNLRTTSSDRMPKATATEIACTWPDSQAVTAA